MASSKKTTAATPAPGPTGRARAAAFPSPNRPPGAPLKRTRPKPCCASGASARWRAFAPRPVGRLPRSWPSSATKTPASSSWNLTLATTKPARKTPKSSISAAKPAWARARPVAHPCLPTAATTCAARPCPPPPSLRPVATSNPAKSSCSSPLPPSKCKSCWPRARPICWTNSSPTARAAPSRRIWCGTRPAAKSALNLSSAKANTLLKKELLPLQKQPLQKQKPPKQPPVKRLQLANLQQPTTTPMPRWPPSSAARPWPAPRR